MKKILSHISILLILSCANEIKKDDLIGKWYRFEQADQVPVGFMSMEFSSDSIFANSPLFSEKSTWSISNNLLITPSPNNEAEQGQLKLRLDSGNYLIIEEKNNQKWGAIFKKSKNFMHFFNQSKGIELPKKNDSTLSKEYWPRTFNIYLTRKKGYSIISTDFSNDIVNIKSDFERYRNSQPIEFHDKLKIFIFKDKDFNEKDVEPILTELKNNYSNPIYRVYNTQIPDYSMEGIYWLTKNIE